MLLRLSDFSEYPGLRESGIEYRENVLMPALIENGIVTVDLDSIGSVCPSFIDEAICDIYRNNIELARKLRFTATGYEWRVRKVSEMVSPLISLSP